LNQYFIPYFGNFSIDRITIQRVEDFEEWRLNKMNSSQMAKSTLNTHNSAVMRVFKLAVSRNWLSEEQIPPFKYEGTKSQVRPGFTRQEYYELARNLRYWADSGVADKDSSKNKFLGDKKPRETTSMNRELLRDYVLILANTGARHGTEMAELKWKDIDWYIDRENKEYLQMTVDGKTGNRQLIARHKVVTYLKRIQSRFDDLSKYSFDELLRARVDEYVFRLRNGSLPKTLDRNFQQYLDKLNLLHGTTSDQKRTLYSLRHFYATYMIENNVSPAILAKQMGTSIGMIEKHYSKFIPNMAAAMLSGERYQDKLGLKNASV
jgi:integrase